MRVVEHWDRLTREAVKTSMLILKTQLDTVMSNLL